MKIYLKAFSHYVRLLCFFFCKIIKGKASVIAKRFLKAGNVLVQAADRYCSPVYQCIFISNPAECIAHLFMLGIHFYSSLSIASLCTSWRTPLKSTVEGFV